MAAPVSGQLGRGLDISLAALRRHDPYIQSIVDVASQVALYTFSHKANEWEKTDVEGTLFVYSRSASPKHGFTIMNRLSMENRTEPITKDLEFQLQDPFLLYRNRLLIYGIWFYNKEECQRIGELMNNFTNQEQAEAQQVAAVSPMMLQPEGKEVDILKMLTKAKDEYTKYKPSSEPKKISNSSAIHSNPNLIKPIAVKPSDSQSHSSNAQHSKPVDPEPQHLSLTTLFGKPEKATAESTEHKDPSSAPRPAVVRSLSYDDPSRLPESSDKHLCPAIQKLLVRGADLLPVSELPENPQSQNGSHHPPGDVFSSLFLPVDDVTPLPAQEADSGDFLLQKLKTEPATHCYYTDPTNTPGKMAANALINFYDNSPQSQRTSSNIPTMPLTSQMAMASGTISPQELLKKLNLVRQDQQCHANPKPTLAAKFPTASPASAKPAWTERPLGEKPNPLLKVISPQRIPATVSPSLLLSPLVFTQSSAQKSADVSNPLFSNMDPKSSRLLPSVPTNTPSKSHALTKSQLCDTLIHLIQNDDGFMNTIYETYLSIANAKSTF